jgi:hypothetical protein
MNSCLNCMLNWCLNIENQWGQERTDDAYAPSDVTIVGLAISLCLLVSILTLNLSNTFLKGLFYVHVHKYTQNL